MGSANSYQGFDDDSIVMDTDLSLLTGGRGFTAIGDKMVMSFREDRLSTVIRRNTSDSFYPVIPGLWPYRVFIGNSSLTQTCR